MSIAADPTASARRTTASRTRAIGRTIQQVRGNLPLSIGGAMLLLLILAAIFADQIAPASPTQQNIMARLRPTFWMPAGSLEHPLGTDALGRDLLSRIIYGTRVSLLVGFSAVVVAAAIGVAVGLVSGYVGGWLDLVAMRIVDVLLSLPFAVFAIVFLVFFGSSLTNTILALGLVAWLHYARLIRSAALRIKSQPMIEAVRCLGATDARIVGRHILPNVSHIFLVTAALDVGSMILAESFLSFIGLGVQPPTPTWGIMLQEGRDYLYEAWWLGTFPGIAIFITVVAINLFGDGLKKARVFG
jgi:peptide/nickel transport system permease protein